MIKRYFIIILAMVSLFSYQAIAMQAGYPTTYAMPSKQPPATAKFQYDSSVPAFLRKRGAADRVPFPQFAPPIRVQPPPVQTLSQPQFKQASLSQAPVPPSVNKPFYNVPQYKPKPSVPFSSPRGASLLPHYKKEQRASKKNFNSSSRSKWKLTFGAGLGYIPKYEGADSSKVLPIPYVDILYDDRLFINSLRGAGAYVVQNDRYAIGPFVTYALGREKDDDVFLSSFDAIDPTIESGIFAEYYWGDYTLKWDIRYDSLGRGHEGILSNLGAYKFFDITDSLSFNGGISTTFADKQYMDNYFSVNPGQSIASGLDVYKTGAGFKDVTLHANMYYLFSDKWSLAWFTNAKSLLGDAKDSPITKQGDDTQYSTGTTVNYHF